MNGICYYLFGSFLRPLRLCGEKVFSVFLFTLILKPRGELFLLHFSGRKVDDGLGGFRFRRNHLLAVPCKEDVAGHEGGAFISVNERVVAKDAIDISRSETEEIRISIGKDLPGPGESGIEEGFIANSRLAAVLGKEPVVQGEDDGFGNPDRVHSAKVRRVFR